MRKTLLAVGVAGLLFVGNSAARAPADVSTTFEMTRVTASATLETCTADELRDCFKACHYLEYEAQQACFERCEIACA